MWNSLFSVRQAGINMFWFIYYGFGLISMDNKCLRIPPQGWSSSSSLVVSFTITQQAELYLTSTNYCQGCLLSLSYPISSISRLFLVLSPLILSLSSPILHLSRLFIVLSLHFLALSLLILQYLLSFSSFHISF